MNCCAPAGCLPLAVGIPLNSRLLDVSIHLMGIYIVNGILVFNILTLEACLRSHFMKPKIFSMLLCLIVVIISPQQCMAVIEFKFNLSNLAHDLFTGTKTNETRIIIEVIEADEKDFSKTLPAQQCSDDAFYVIEVNDKTDSSKPSKKLDVVLNGDILDAVLKNYIANVLTIGSNYNLDKQKGAWFYNEVVDGIHIMPEAKIESWHFDNCFFVVNSQDGVITLTLSGLSLPSSTYEFIVMGSSGDKPVQPIFHIWKKIDEQKVHSIIIQIPSDSEREKLKIEERRLKIEEFKNKYITSTNITITTIIIVASVMVVIKSRRKIQSIKTTKAKELLQKALDAYKQNNPSEAERLFEKSIELAQFGNSYLKYAQFLHETDKYQKAISILKNGLQCVSDDVWQLHRELVILLAEKASIHNDKNLKEIAYHTEEAYRLGMTKDSLPTYINDIINLSKIPELGKKAWYFLKNTGFNIQVATIKDGVYADFILTSKSPEYIETYGLQGSILAKYFFHGTEWEDIEEVSKNIEESLENYGGIDLNKYATFWILDSAASFENALYRFAEAKQKIIIPLEQSIFKDSSPEEERKKALRSVVDKWLSRRDLFLANTPVSGRQFFGRQLELQRLMGNINEGKHTGIYGLRKVGKTSLMYQMLEKRVQDFVIYIDLQKASPQDCTYLYWKIARELQKVINQKFSDLLLGTVTLELGSKPEYSRLNQPVESVSLGFNEDINRLLLALSRGKNKSSKIVIMIDELECMLPMGSRSGYKGYVEFFANLRGIAQENPGRLVSIVAAANSAISDESKLEGKSNPMFLLYENMFLPPLNQQECCEMIEKLGRGMGVSFDEKSLDYIYNETGGHPYITRAFCSFLVTENKDRPLSVKPELITQSISAFVLQRSEVFNEIIERLDSFPEEKKLFEYIASTDNGILEESQLSSISSNPIDKSLRHLLGYQIVGYTDGKYSIKINLLHRWMKRFLYLHN